MWFLSNASKTFCPSFHVYQTLLVCGPNCLNLWRDCSKAFSNSGWALFSSPSVQPSQSMSSQTGNLTLPCPSSALLVMKYKLQGARCGYTGEKNQPNLSLSTFLFIKAGLALCVNPFFFSKLIWKFPFDLLPTEAPTVILHAFLFPLLFSSTVDPNSCYLFILLSTMCFLLLSINELTGKFLKM